MPVTVCLYIQLQRSQIFIYLLYTRPARNHVNNPSTYLFGCFFLNASLLVLGVELMHITGEISGDTSV